jgi:hypothetical protein
MTPMVWHQGIHDRMGMQRMRREGVESAPGLVPWRGKGRSGTGVFAWCLSEFVGIEYRQPNSFRSRRGDQIKPLRQCLLKSHSTGQETTQARNGTKECVGNKVAGMFSCGQRDLCHLSEAQPQAGNRVRSKIWDKEKEQHKQEMGQRGRNNA